MTKFNRGPSDVRGAVRRHLARALAALQSRRPLAAEAVHRVRKELKRARAGLRLLRDAVGKRAYARENIRLRNAARPLAPLRDADVRAATLAGLLERRLPHLQRGAAARSCARARAQAAALRRQAPALEEIVIALQATDRRVAQWRLPREVRPVLGAGLQRIFRRGRKALAKARANGSDRNLHEARKHVKYLGAALDILQPAVRSRAAAFAKFARRADAAAEALGLDHDLALLRRQLGRAASGFTELIERRRGKLQKRALKQARRLYQRKPGLAADKPATRARRAKSALS